MLGRAVLGLMLVWALPLMAQTGTAQTGVPQKASAEDPVQLLAAGEWRAFAAGPAADRVCYVTHTPAAMATEMRRGTRPMLYVTHRPARPSYDVVSFVAGYRFQADSLARMSFAGGPTYRLFTSEDFAWATSEADDRKILKALTESTFVTVTGLALDGHLFTDTLALAGFPAAFQRASAECRRPGAPARR